MNPFAPKPDPRFPRLDAIKKEPRTAYERLLEASAGAHEDANAPGRISSRQDASVPGRITAEAPKGLNEAEGELGLDLPAKFSSLDVEVGAGVRRDDQRQGPVHRNDVDCRPVAPRPSTVTSAQERLAAEGRAAHLSSPTRIGGSK
jgi:hypothetical protein